MIKTARSFKSISLSLLSSVLLFTSAATPALAEYWSPSGNNIYKNNFGNVGIGISSPLTPLHVNIDSSTYGAIRVSEGATTAIDFGDATGVGVNGIAALFSNGTEKIRLFADPTQNSWINAGNLGIGTTTPGYKLDVNGNAKVAGSPASTPLLTVDSNADGKYSVIVKGPNPGLAIQNINDPVTTGLYKLTPSGNALLLYQNTAAAGDFSSQDNLMAWRNGKTGIGTISPQSKLHVQGTAEASGAVGINGAIPGTVVGGQATGLAVNGYTGLAGLRINGGDVNNTIYQPNGYLGIKTSVGSSIRLGDTNSTGLTVTGGNVSIGSGTAGYQLSVSGTTKFTGNPATTPVLMVESTADGKYSTYIHGPNPGLAIRNTGEAATTGLYRFVSTGSSLQLHQNTAAAGDFSTKINAMTWKAGGDISVTSGNIEADKNAGTITTASITSIGWKSEVVSFPKVWSAAPTVVVSRYYGGTGSMTIPEIIVLNTTVSGFTIMYNVTYLGTAGTVQFNWMAL